MKCAVSFLAALGPESEMDTHYVTPLHYPLQRFLILGETISP